MNGVRGPRDWLGRIRIKLTRENRVRIHAEVAQGSTHRRSYYALVVLSTTVAALGLLVNSTAVVIGAMLIAPLMGPIFGIALALTTGDRALLSRAFFAEAIGVTLSIAWALFIGWAGVYGSFGNEILARTEPTLYDVFIAFASGAAGAYALVDTRLGAAIPGVAIATALVPPLATTGLCLAAGLYEGALGAALLFFANFLAIELSAALVFLFAGLGRGESEQPLTPGLLFRRFGLSLLLLVAVGAYLTRALLGIVTEQRTNEAIRAAISADVGATNGAHLSDIQLRRSRAGIDVFASVLTPQEFSSEQVARIESVLQKQVDPSIHLVLRSLLSKDMDHSGPVFVPQETLRRREADARANALLSTLSTQLRRLLLSVPGAELADLRQEPIAGGIRVTAIIRTPTVIEPPTVGLWQNSLKTASSSPISLQVRSVLTRDADANGYPSDYANLAKADREKMLMIKEILEQQLYRTDATIRLVALGAERRQDRLTVTAEIRSRILIRPQTVAKIQHRLRQTTEPKLDLTVRTTLGADATGLGYVPAASGTR